MRILCYGDSNTWGYNPENAMRFEHRWTKELAKLLPEDEIIEEGLNGRNINREDPFWPGRNGFTILPVLLRTHRPIDLVITMLGSNDLKKVHNISTEILSEDLRKTIQILQNKDLSFPYDIPSNLIVAPVELEKEIFFNSPWADYFDEDSYFTSKKLADAYEEVCKEYDIPFFNAATVARASETDSLHLDEANHLKLAQALAKEIEKIKETMTKKED